MFRFAKLSCQLGVTTRSFCAKPQLVWENVQSSFSRNEIERILATINASNSDDLAKFVSKTRATRLKTFREQRGPVKNLEEVLNVEGFGVIVLRDLCKKILTYEPKEAKEPKPKQALKLCTPAVAEETRRAIRSCVGVNVSVNSISWARLSLKEAGKTHLITDWNDLEVPDRLHLCDLAHLTKSLCHRLPEADAFVLETPAHQQPSVPGKNVTPINVNIERSQIVAMLALGLMYKNPQELVPEEQNQSVFFLKTFLPARLFRTLVGQERVSTKQTVEELLRNAVIRQTREAGAAFEAAEASRKDHLGQALLVAHTFARVCVEQDEEGLRILNRRGKSKELH